MIRLTADTGTLETLTDGLNEAVQAAEEVHDKLIAFDFSSLLPQLLQLGVKVLVVALIWIIGKKLIQFVLRIFEKTASYNHFDISVTKFLSILIRWLMYFMILCFILNYLNIGTASLVAVLGSAGLAIGLSLKDSLANFAGSVILLAMKPFKVGDFISTSAGDGTVKIIGLIYTTLITLDKREIHIPNATLANSNIINVSASPTRLLCLPVGISYSSDLKKAKSLLEQTIRESEYMIPETDINVFVAELGESCVKLEGRCTVKAEDYWTAKWYFNEKIKEIYDEENIEIPFTQMDIHVKQ